MNRYNLITAKNQVTPNYEIGGKEITFEIYVSPEEEVCVVGTVDNNYICWCSITKGADKDTNVEILNDLLTEPQERLYGTKFKVLESRYQEIMQWHSFTVSKAWHHDQYRYRSPVSNSFLGAPPYNNGIFLAAEIRAFFRKELRKCEYRLVDPVYVKVLQSYKRLLTMERSPEYYHHMLPVIDILKHEAYLKLCPDVDVRKLYLECLDLCSSLYNTYMSASR
ncbi:hypothetical protein [Paenibacillus sacheonensis]|uniref:Uncharacterized protein n=1 Tax=Paenibacillus sacheonensis TaxID=742054 RepID=A0A7X5C1L6_9BACL|nr:hypothetical protein [Paenibacillus sacheonensis]MBM7565520.1 hypothetical protein [Paenibacillus sacheonensis]NBC69559.1 hypothetical protein [Paenibacillus sacheonensis]